MAINVGAASVAAGQKVGGNQREAESKKAFTAFWNKTSATIGQIVGITGTANIVIKNPSQVMVNILFSNGTFASAESVTVSNGKITAQWKVKAFKAGNFKDGVYDVEIRYNGSLAGKTTVPLKIVDVVRTGDFFG